mmetsp:Transcript_3870/g.9283  ORF Transcript_3870/g.9283 Transcript_3870/m.9283 type:complete len:204 (-) Transcript_3870:227-838(-)
MPMVHIISKNSGNTISFSSPASSPSLPSLSCTAPKMISRSCWSMPLPSRLHAFNISMISLKFIEPAACAAAPVLLSAPEYFLKMARSASRYLSITNTTSLSASALRNCSLSLLHALGRIWFWIRLLVFSAKLRPFSRTWAMRTKASMNSPGSNSLSTTSPTAPGPFAATKIKSILPPNNSLVGILASFTSFQNSGLDMLPPLA